MRTTAFVLVGLGQAVLGLGRIRNCQETESRPHRSHADTKQLKVWFAGGGELGLPSRVFAYELTMQ